MAKTRTDRHGEAYYRLKLIATGPRCEGLVDRLVDEGFVLWGDITAKLTLDECKYIEEIAPTYDVKTERL